jgi:sec-independent protein translocase protein TatB
VFLDLNFTKLLVLGVLALLIFGPDRLPTLAAQAGRALRELRRMAEGAKSELQENLGPEFRDFDINDLNPRHFVRKHLVNEFTGDGALFGVAATGGEPASYGDTQAQLAALAPGEVPPYDAEAT